jgi:DNA-binding IclR family transcriptional regulator
MEAIARMRQRSAPMLTVERGLKVLRAFGSDRAPLSNADLAKCTALPKASISRLTSTLLQLGYLRHVPGGRAFELSTGSLAMGHAFIVSSDLLQAVQPLLQDLANRLDVSVALGIRDGLDILYVAYRASIQTGTLRLGVGSVLPMARTAIGRAYLYGLPNAERIRLIERLRAAAGEQWGRLDRHINLSLRQIDRTGTCAVLAGYQRGTYAIALPVRLGRQGVLMALSCGKAQVKPNLPEHRKRISPELLACASELEQALANFDGP